MFKKILLSVDLSDESSWVKALPEAVDYCQAFGATLHVVTVVPDFIYPDVGEYFPPEFEQEMIDRTTERLEKFCQTEIPAEIPTTLVVAHGTIYHEIITTAETVEADLIVMASHRPALQDYLIGPNSTRVVRHFNGSVLVVRN